jgi:glucose-1-phosphate adenylyltransferase
MAQMLGNYITPVPAQQRRGKQWYQGSADAIYQSMNLINDERPDIIVVFGADHVYRMDASQMVDAHVESGASATVAGIRVPRTEADQFGVIKTGADGIQIEEFLEKPSEPPGLVDSPEESFASMGNYVFTADALCEALNRDADNDQSKHDMGGDIVPLFVEGKDAAVYDFNRNDVPGSTPKDRDYWRDVGTIRSYHEAHLDLVSVEPVFNLYNSRWPIFTSHPQLPGAKFVEEATVDDAIVAAGSIVSGATLTKSVLGYNVYVATDAVVERSVVMDNVRLGPGARVVNAIIDKNVVVPDGVEIGVDAKQDRAAGFEVVDGITVLAKRQSVAGTYTGPRF